MKNLILQLDDSNYYIKAKINQKYMTGSIVRYELEKDNLKILVDLLNKDDLNINSEELILKISKSQIINLEDSKK